MSVADSNSIQRYRATSGSLKEPKQVLDAKIGFEKKNHNNVKYIKMSNILLASQLHLFGSIKKN